MQALAANPRDWNGRDDRKAIPPARNMKGASFEAILIPEDVHTSVVVCNVGDGEANGHGIFRNRNLAFIFKKFMSVSFRHDLTIVYKCAALSQPIITVQLPFSTLGFTSRTTTAYDIATPSPPPRRRHAAMLLSINILLLVLLPLLALCAEDYYKILGVSKSASDRELKKAYRSYAKKHHPDKNPNDPTAKQKFQEVADAYDALSNAETRKIYDQYGHEGLKQHKQSGGRGGGGGHDPFDLFSRFFGGGGHFGGGERRGPNMEVRVTLPLKDFYNGLETEIAVEKQMICEACGGSGS